MITRAGKSAGSNAARVFHCMPLHLSPMGRRYGYAKGDLPITEDLAKRVIRLPCYFELSEKDQKRIVAAIASFLGS